MTGETPDTAETRDTSQHSHHSSAVHDSQSPLAHLRGPGTSRKCTSSSASNASGNPGLTRRDGLGAFMLSGIGLLRPSPYLTSTKRPSSRVREAYQRPASSYVPLPATFCSTQISPLEGFHTWFGRSSDGQRRVAREGCGAHRSAMLSAAAHLLDLGMYW